MNQILNYLIEANLGLVFFYALYWLLLHNENQFTFKRLYLLVGLVASLLFPLITIPAYSTQLIPSLGNSIGVYWLPEITISAYTSSARAESQTSIWQWITYLYLAGLIFFSILFAIRVLSLVRLFRSSTKYSWKNYQVIESENGYGSFSFFHYIFLGKASELNDREKQEILNHEEVHAQKIHSLDIILVNVLGIIFWFNPVIHLYRNSFVQIHEFEADARSVEGRDVNAYCNLLARVALQSNGYPLASHFTNSFTLKRITMMKTVRKKLNQWKVGAVSLTTVLFFIVVACQDQVMQDIQTITDNSSAAIALPAEVEAQLIKLKKDNPKAEFIVLEMNDEGKKKLEEYDKNEEFTKSLISMSVVKTADQSFVILQKGEKTNMLADMTVADGEVFTVVEEMATPEGGFPKLYEHIMANLKYPLEARSKGTEGKVFVEFVVNTDGTLSDIITVKGIGSGCDEEAIQVLKNCPISWLPGKQRGQSVKQRLVIPILFKLGESTPAGIVIGESQNAYPKNDLEFTVILNKENTNGITRLNGQVKNENGGPLVGTNIVIQGTNTGTVVKQDGSYQLDATNSSGTLVFSFIGYKTKAVSY